MIININNINNYINIIKNNNIYKSIKYYFKCGKWKNERNLKCLNRQKYSQEIQTILRRQVNKNINDGGKPNNKFC